MSVRGSNLTNRDRGRRCPNCGKLLPRTTRYCAYCGACLTPRWTWRSPSAWVVGLTTAVVVGLGAAWPRPLLHPAATSQPASLLARAPTETGHPWHGRLTYALRTGGGLTIHVLAADGGQSHVLVPGHSPAWSPDGTQIAFVSERTGTAQVYLISATGRSLTQLTHSPDGKSDPAWSPQGGSIGLLAHTGDETRLQIVDVRGTTSKDLSGPNAGRVKGFSWAPDGQDLLFDAATDSRREIWRVSADGSGLGRFTNFTGQEPSWSPDGQRIAFASEDGIYVVDRAGTNLRRLTTFSGSRPSWSPDSQRILFLSKASGEGTAPDLWSMNADGANQKRVGVAGCWMVAWTDRPNFVLCIAGSAMSTVPAMHVLDLDLETAAGFSIVSLSEPTLSWTK